MIKMCDLPRYADADMEEIKKMKEAHTVLNQTAGTFFLIQPVNASRILRNHTCIAYFRTFSTLCAHSNMMASILLVGNADAGFHWIRNLVKCL